MRRLAAALLGAAALPALAQAATLTVRTPWMRYLLPNLPAAGYLVIQNHGAAPVTLTGAAAPACGTLMLHQSKDSSGTAMMMDVPSLVIPAGGGVTFAPGGYHLMCMQPRMKVGDRISVTLSFADGTRVATTMMVYGAGGSP